MAQAGISTLGVLFGYATGNTKPTAFTKLNRINKIGGIEITPETIDASALEDLVTRSVAGRADNGGTVTVTVNLTNETITEWTTLFTAYTSMASGDQMWFEVYSPYLTKAFFFVAQPPTTLPMPEIGQNELQTVEISLTIEEYKGLDTAIAPV